MRGVALAVALALASRPTAAEGGKLYRCDAKSVMQLRQDDGTMGIVEPFGNFSSMLIDVESGTIRFNDGSAWHMRVVQRGDGSQDTILAGDESQPRSPVENFIRISAWSWQPRMTYMLVVLHLVASGTCDAVK